MKEATETVVPKVANGADLEANGEVATEDMKEATEAVMLTANGEVTEAAMEVTEEVTPQDLEAKPHGVWPEVCVEETSEECEVGVVWKEATEAVMLTANGEVTEAAMEVTE